MPSYLRIILSWAWIIQCYPSCIIDEASQFSLAESAFRGWLSMHFRQEVKRHPLQCVLLKAGVIAKEGTLPDFLLDLLLIWLEIVAWARRVAPIEEQLAPFRLVELEALPFVLRLQHCFGDYVAIKLAGLEPGGRAVGSVGRVEVQVIHGYYIRFLLQ